MKKTLTLALTGALVLSLAAPALAAEPSAFTDVAENAWYADAVSYVTAEGIMSGTGKTTFSPAATVTRGMVIQTLYNLAGAPAVDAKTSFTDLDGKWYGTASVWAEQEGLAAVPADKTFAGDRTITRAELAVLLSRYAALTGVTSEEGGMAMREAPDYDQIPSWALEGMSFCYYADILKGDSRGYLNPNGAAQRAELAQILMQFSSLTQTEAPEPMSGAVREIEKYGHAVLDISIADFEKAGFALGDTVDVVFDNGYTLSGIPYFNGYYVDKGEAMLRAYPGDTYLAVCINYGKLNETAGVQVGSTATISLAQKGAERDTQELNSLVYTDERSDYSSDAVFANFRAVTVGDIAEGALYRSASPVNNEHGRASYADALIQKAGVKTVLNLADHKEDIDGYLAAEDFASPYYKILYEAGSVIPLGMPVDYSSESFGADLTAGLAKLSQQPGPYLVHCTEGKDRAGFTSALLECLMGASLDEVVADYMVSYENYYGVTQAGQPEKYQLIVKNNILDMLRTIAGVEKDADLSGVDLQAAAEDYLTGFGMTAEQLTALKTNLSTPASH
ncbi:S-layer homology domain-containing protein [Pseudoflavonifractor gallinarum]|uniref:S-layer homology domain-containing protein n=1 Tax=Pseudoflavonifractor gallinarum TaxID=2779352 RepID=UPI0036F38A97